MSVSIQFEYKSFNGVDHYAFDHQFIFSVIINHDYEFHLNV